MTANALTSNLRGAGFMALSMLGFAIEDVLIKTIGVRIPAGEIIAVTAGGSALCFIIWLLVKGQPVFVAAHLNRRVLLRTAFDMFGSVCFISALMRMDVTLLSAIIQATPLVVALGGVLFLGQSVGWRRWSAILVGFGGVLLIIRPEVGGVSTAMALGILGMLGLAGRDLATRALNIPVSGTHLALHAFLGLVPAGLFLCWLDGDTLIVPIVSDIAILFACVGVLLVAYLALVAATRSGDAAYISMFRYSRMVFALVLGVVILGERPDTLTLVGVSIVIAAGLFTFLREARTRRTSQAAPDPV